MTPVAHGPRGIFTCCPGVRPDWNGNGRQDWEWAATGNPGYQRTCQGEKQASPKRCHSILLKMLRRAGPGVLLWTIAPYVT